MICREAAPRWADPYRADRESLPFSRAAGDCRAHASRRYTTPIPDHLSALGGRDHAATIASLGGLPAGLGPYAVWDNFPRNMFRRMRGAFANSARWSGLLTVLIMTLPVSLLDNTPLGGSAHYSISPRSSANRRAIDCVHRTFSAIHPGSRHFFQDAPTAPWARARLIGVPRPSTGIIFSPRRAAFIFPPVRIHREYFGDGSMRQIAPVSPALHLGADRLLVIGVGRQALKAERTRSDTHPSLAQIAGHALNSIFLDSLEVDLERLQRINRTLEMIPQALLAESNASRGRFRVITPARSWRRSRRRTAGLPRTIRLLLHAVVRCAAAAQTCCPCCSRALLPRASRSRLQRYDGPKDDLVASSVDLGGTASPCAGEGYGRDMLQPGTLRSLWSPDPSVPPPPLVAGAVYPAASFMDW